MKLGIINTLSVLPKAIGEPVLLFEVHKARTQLGTILVHDIKQCLFDKRDRAYPDCIRPSSVTLVPAESWIAHYLMIVLASGGTTI